MTRGCEETLYVFVWDEFKFFVKIVDDVIGLRKSVSFLKATNGGIFPLDEQHVQLTTLLLNLYSCSVAVECG